MIDSGKLIRRSTLTGSSKHAQPGAVALSHVSPAGVDLSAERPQRLEMVRRHLHPVLGDIVDFASAWDVLGNHRFFASLFELSRSQIGRLRNLGVGSSNPFERASSPLISENSVGKGGDISLSRMSHTFDPN